MKKNIIIAVTVLVIVTAGITSAILLAPKSNDKVDNSLTESIDQLNRVNEEQIQTESDITDTDSDNSATASYENKSNNTTSLAESGTSNTSSSQNSKTSSQSSKPSSSRTNTTTSKSTSSTSSTASSSTSDNTTTQQTQNNTTQESEPETVVMPEIKSNERYDGYGNLIIDTDTLDGKKAVAITFDDGPGKYTEKLLDGLRERNAHATFFMVGSCVEQYPQLLQIMVNDGHQLGNHTYSHPRITSLNESGWRKEIEVTDKAIFDACGQFSTAFRPPYGSYNQYQARSINKTVTLWSVDTLDWKSRNKDSIKKIISSEVCDGSIILLHDLYETSVDAALESIDELQQEGYIFVTVDQLLTRYGYMISNTAHFSQQPAPSNITEQQDSSDDEDDTDLYIDTDEDIYGDGGEDDNENEDDENDEDPYVEYYDYEENDNNEIYDEYEADY